ncbi:hypothetical protein RND81_05G160200 [Saponaria officinalis]|uniref:Uncharacterized protein n=1 Tax=Saponaria officinalis TaxID=3572 RepID=A0AAW1KZ57_SAPOF
MIELTLFIVFMLLCLDLESFFFTYCAYSSRFGVELISVFRTSLYHVQSFKIVVKVYEVV